MSSIPINWITPLVQNNWIRAVVAAVATVSSTLYAYFRHITPNQLSIERVNIPIADLPPALDGFTIAQLSDFHYLPHTKLPLIERAVAQTNALRPDLIVLTGDYINRQVAGIFELSVVLARLRAEHGVYAILGNHDTSLSKPHVREIIHYSFATYGIRLLVNEQVTLTNGLVVAGLDEIHNGRPNLERTIANAPADAPVLVLMHQPDVADFVARNPRAVLQLSGHTHGGQVDVPGMRPLYLPHFGRKYIRGRYRIGNLWLYVNRGIGLARLGPFRVNCPPEITLLTLTRAGASI